MTVSPWQQLAQSPLPARPASVEALDADFKRLLLMKDAPALQALLACPPASESRWAQGLSAHQWCIRAVEAGWSEGLDVLLSHGVPLAMREGSPWWRRLSARDDVESLLVLHKHGYEVDWKTQSSSDRAGIVSDFMRAPRLFRHLLTTTTDFPFPPRPDFSWMKLALEHNSDLGASLQAAWKTDPTIPEKLSWHEVPCSGLSTHAQQLWGYLVSQDSPELAQRALGWGWGPSPQPASYQSATTWTWEAVHQRSWRMFEWMMQIPALRESFAQDMIKNPEKTLWVAFQKTTPGSRAKFLAHCPDWDPAWQNKEGRNAASIVWSNAEGVSSAETSWWVKRAPLTLSEGKMPALSRLSKSRRARVEAAILKNGLPSDPPPARSSKSRV